MRTSVGIALYNEDSDEWEGVSGGNPLPVVVGLPRDFNTYVSKLEESNAQVKSTQGKLHSFSVYNNNAATQWIQFHDAASAPANGAIPFLVFEVAAQTTLPIEFTHGKKFHNGIFVCTSSTDTTKTTGVGDCLFNIDYE